MIGAAIQDHVCGNPQFKILIGDSRTRDLIRLHHLLIVSCKYQETSGRMNVAGRVRASFDALLLRAEQDRWVNFTGEGTRQCACKVQLIQSEAGYLLNCKQDGQVILTHAYTTLHLIVNFCTRRYTGVMSLQL